MACQYRGRTKPTADDVVITIDDATDSNSDEISPWPMVTAVPDESGIR
jgi:hypothetical protein